MDTKELMLGDWVDDTTLHGSSVVKEIRGEEVGLLRVHDNWHYIKHINMGVKPIPLTNEILEKNGWKRTSTSGSAERWSLVENNMHIVIDHPGNNPHDWRVIINSLILRNTRIEYVHLLQHVLRIFQIEKEIVL